MSSNALEIVDFFDMVGQTEWNRGLQRTLIHWIGLRYDHQVLDVGSGSGRFVMQMAQRVDFVTGVDASSEMVYRAEQNTKDFKLDNTSFVIGDISDLPFPDSTFDVVTCQNLLFLFTDYVIPLREMMRVCKASGEIILLEPSAQMNPWSAETYCNKRNFKDFERDSFLSWATASARQQLLHDHIIHQAVHDGGGKVVDSLPVLDNLATIWRITPVSE
jgi:ubiquinone/menaquinone biosynthesis C-methylase UbiE